MDRPPSKNGKKTGKGKFTRGNKLGPGRPAGSRNKATLAVEALLDGESEALTRKAIELALEGDGQALRICLDRICPPRKSRPVTFDLPSLQDAGGMSEAMIAVLNAVAKGDLTPDEANSIAGLIEVSRKAYETEELEARIARLEKTK